MIPCVVIVVLRYVVSRLLRCGRCSNKSVSEPYPCVLLASAVLAEIAVVYRRVIAVNAVVQLSPFVDFSV